MQYCSKARSRQRLGFLFAIRAWIGRLVKQATAGKYLTVHEIGKATQLTQKQVYVVLTAGCFDSQLKNGGPEKEYRFNPDKKLIPRRRKPAKKRG